MAAPFRVLAIDGGGIRGVIPATVLVELERRLAPRSLATVFDLIVGTSTGGIIALGWAAPTGEKPRHTAQELLDLYMNDAESIFPGGGRVAHPRAGWLRDGTRYLASELEEMLVRFFGDVPMTAALTGVVVTSYDLAHGEPVTLSSRTEFGGFGDLTMVAAARATSAAPMFFAPEIVVDGERERVLVDGGLYANNPSVLGYLLGGQVAAREDLPLVLVSLGTGARGTRAALRGAERVQMRDASTVVRAVLEAVSTGSGNLGHLLLARVADDDRFRYWRLQTTVGSCSFTMDDSSPDNVACLYERALELVSECDEELSAITHALVP